MDNETFKELFSDWYDLEGNQLKSHEDYMECQRNKKIGYDKTIDGKIVSTVWLGLNHARSGENKLIFETMVFPSEDDYSELYCDRYGTKEDALAGHKKALEVFKNEQTTNKDN